MRKKEIIKNVSSSWVSLGVNILVGLFLSPFILHRLGNMAYGAWVLVFSVTGYYGLFDLGIRSSIVRYVSTYTARNDIEGLSRIINTGLAGYTAIGVLAMAATLAVSSHVDSLFRMQPSFVATARVMFLIVGASVSLGFPTGIFGGILEGLGRFDVVSATNIVSTVIRAGLIVLALTHGYGLLAVTVITVVLPLLASAVRGAIVLHVLPLRFGWRYLNRGALREIAHYSSISFILMLSYKLRFKTDEIVISTLMSVTAVTFFSIGGRLVDYTQEVVSGLAQLVIPLSGRSDAKGDMDGLRRIFLVGNRACALIVLPIEATLIILGKSVLTAWVGARYVAPCYPVLLTMLIPSSLLFAQGASGRILYGMARHRSLAWVTGMEGIANLILSIVLIRPYGVVGDAMGTAIPLTCTALFFLPRHLCRILNIKVKSFLVQAYTLPILLVLPTVLMLLLMRHWFFARTYLQVALQVLIGMVPYALGLSWAIWTGRIWKVDHQAHARAEEPVSLPLVETEGD